MAKLNYKKYPLQNTVLPNLVDGIEYLNQALNGMNSLNIPADFKYKNQLEQICDELIFIKSKLKDDENWLIQSMSKINRIEEEFNQMSHLLPKSDIKVRNTTIL